MAYKKYRNVITELDGIKFASMAESRRYQELKLLLDNGYIGDLTLQPRYVLQESYVNGEGKKIKAIEYVADFRYFEFEHERWIIEDVKRKQTATDVYKIKRKIFEKVHYPKMIVEVDA